MRAAEALQCLGVGRVTGLRLLAGREADLLVEDGAQLRRRVDVELVAGQLLHLVLQCGRRRRERVGDLLQLVPVDADAGHFHFRQHAHQRGLDVIVQPHHALRDDALPEAVRHAGHVGRLRRRVHGHVTRRLPGLDDVERQLARLFAQLLQRVLAGRGVEQIGRYRRVHLETGQVDAQREQRPHGFLDVVPDDRAGQDGVELLGHRRRRQQRARDQHTEPGFVSFGGDEDEPGQLAAARGPGPTGRQGEPPRAECAQLLGHLRRRRRHGDVLQLERRRGRFRRGGPNSR